MNSTVHPNFFALYFERLIALTPIIWAQCRIYSYQAVSISSSIVNDLEIISFILITLYGRLLKWLFETHKDYLRLKRKTVFTKRMISRNFLLFHEISFSFSATSVSISTSEQTRVERLRLTRKQLAELARYTHTTNTQLDPHFIHKDQLFVYNFFIIFIFNRK